MKRLPIGIQSIGDVIKDGFVYVDKTALIYEMMRRGKYYFLARPRRFGKSLLVSTLHAIFSGERELFRECAIFSKDLPKSRHPVILFDFTQISASTPKELEESLRRLLETTATSYGCSIETPTLKEGLASLVKALAKEEKVVILVDEYDKPIVDNLYQKELMQQIRKILKNFFGTLKGLDAFLRFVFVTGVSKFAHVSLFSDLNNLQDISLHPSYATLTGYTEEELKHSFHDHIAEIAKREQKSFDEVILAMREWYNGYRFSEKTSSLYNPYSVLNFLDSGRFSNYWFATGTPLLKICTNLFITERELTERQPSSFTDDLRTRITPATKQQSLNFQTLSYSYNPPNRAHRGLHSPKG